MDSGSWKVFGLSAVILTLVMAFGFLVGQQVLRMSSDDPQISGIEGVYEALTAGQDPSAFSSLPPVDPTKSLLPFVVVFDSEGKLVGGTLLLEGQNLEIQKSVLESSKKTNSKKITWQPKKGVRLASVIKPYAFEEKQGYILVGKSLRENDYRTINLLKVFGFFWIVSLIIIFLSIHLLFKKEVSEIVKLEEVKIE